MRKRELIRKLREMNERKGPSWLYSRKGGQEFAVQDLKSLHELDGLLPEIIEKLEAP